jgi:AraC-like DNA-binding protein
MTFQPSKTQGNPFPFPSLEDCDDFVPIRRLPFEQRWRQIEAVGAGAPGGLEIRASRWVDDRTCPRRHETQTPADRHVVAIAMTGTVLTYSRGARTLHEGMMPAGTIHVAGPNSVLAAEFHAPCDFVHFSICNDCFRRRKDVAPGDFEPHDVDDFMIRDILIERMARSLIESKSCYDEFYAESIGHAIVMRILGQHPRDRRSAASKVAPLPRWRLKRVQEHVDRHIDASVTLSDLASAAGLSRMHFAAQFRAATGYRPHEYLLFRRIERAKVILSNETLPLVEVALSVGFQAQAHFSTVFKRMTGETPARWRRLRRESPGPILDREMR